MIKKSVTLTNPEGLHARPAALFVKEANKYESNLEIESENRRVNGKSIIGIMSLGAFHGEEITLSASGPDEEDMVNSLAQLLEKGFE
ncbi:HPr family phosphocarrier protein [Gudongella sp. SC589]|jgi:phosphotransferase system HPr (HPr) family protein|uniref:HPr family phosphocarrier protein n=1 Tax=Gudongella sp. SC589 TaxID=3385990 RepID=UPI003904AE7B